MKSYVYDHISPYFFHKDKYLLQICKENQNTNFRFVIFISRKLCRLWDNVDKYDTARQTTVKVECWEEQMRVSWWKSKARIQTHVNNVEYVQLHRWLVPSDHVTCFMQKLTKTEKVRNYVSAITTCLANLYI
jgi:hypothetical protein